MNTSIISLTKEFGGLLSFTWTPSLYSSLLFTILAFVAGILAYFYQPIWGVRKVPGPPAFPLVGHLPFLAKHGLDLFSTLANRYGPIYRFHMGRQPLVIVANADLCSQVSMKKFKDMPNRSIPSAILASPLYLTGLLWMRGTRWSTMKNAILPLYQQSHLSKLIPMMQSIIETAAQNLPTDDRDIKFDEFALKLGTDIIGESTFGFNFGLSKPNNNQQGDEKIESFVKLHMYSTRIFKVDLSGSYSTIVGILLPILQKPLRHILCRIPYTMDQKILIANKKINDHVEEIVLKKMEKKERGSNDFLSQLLNARETDSVAKELFTLKYISGLTYEHLLGGPTTISFTLSAIVYLVSGHPEVEKKLLEEIDAFGPHDQVPTGDDLQLRFPYLDQVLKESMRFYPIFPLIPRETLTKVEIGGYILPKGTWVWMATGVLAKDPRNFPEPDKFKPERYDPNGEEEKQRHPYAYNPFGMGPRACLGEKFSLQEIKLAVIHLYQRYVFQHSPNMKTPMEFDYGIVLSFKHGLPIRAIKRT